MASCSSGEELVNKIMIPPGLSSETALAGSGSVDPLNTNPFLYQPEQFHHNRVIQSTKLQYSIHKCSSYSSTYYPE